MKLLRQLVIQCFNVCFIAILLSMGWMLYNVHIAGDLLIIFLVIVTVTVFPLYTYWIEHIYKKILPFRYEDLYLQTVDMFLSLQSYDDIIKVIFERVLRFIGVNSGLLIFYSHATDDYTIYYQKQQKQKIIRKARIDKNNIILKIIQSGDDILIKSKLDPSLHFQRSIIFEMEKLGGEIIIPIYYHDIFLGLMVIGEKKTRISRKDILMLKALASKIATVTVNSFFMHELIKNKEIEKEYELSFKVLKKFLPPDEGFIHNTHYRVMHHPGNEAHYFFSIYNCSDSISYIIICSLKANIPLLSLLIPAISVLFQSYARLGYYPLTIIKKINAVIKKKELIDKDLSLLVLKKCNNNYSIGKSRTSDVKLFVYNRSNVKPVVLNDDSAIIRNPVQLIIARHDMAAIKKNPGLLDNTVSLSNTIAENEFIMILTRA